MAELWWKNSIRELQGDHLNKFCFQRLVISPKIVFHRESQQVAVVGIHEFSVNELYIEIYTKDGEFLRSISIFLRKPLYSLQGIAVTTEGCIVVVPWYPSKVIVI